jgi:PIN domain nuclease of toxin-antitoxin system
VQGFCVSISFSRALPPALFGKKKDENHFLARLPLIFSKPYLSVVSIWESIIKYQRGRLPLPESPETYLPRQRDRHQITSLAIDEGSVARLIQLPAIHGDPFDRMLICQALQHDLTIATVDTKIRSYSVSIL